MHEVQNTSVQQHCSKSFFNMYARMWILFAWRRTPVTWLDRQNRMLTISDISLKSKLIFQNSRKLLEDSEPHWKLLWRLSTHLPHFQLRRKIFSVSPQTITEKGKSLLMEIIIENTRFLAKNLPASTFWCLHPIPGYREWQRRTSWAQSTRSRARVDTWSAQVNTSKATR